MSLAYLGHAADAIREGARAVALQPIEKDHFSGPYYSHILCRIYLKSGEPDKAIDLLEQITRIPYILSPGWLKIDPNFDSIRKNPRFQRLVAGS